MTMAVRFKLEGAGVFIGGLEKFNKDVAKALKKDIAAGAERIVKTARADVIGPPLSGWGPWIQYGNGRDLTYSPSLVRSGLHRATDRHKRRGITVAYGMNVIQQNAAGAIYEFAGSKNESGEFFADLINARFGAVKKVPRRLGAAYYAEIEGVKELIQKAVEKAESKASH